MTKSTWAEDQARCIADTVKNLRGNRSGQWLSDETEKSGHRISRTTISEIENGKRKAVTTVELLVLARALRVSPVQLLFPDLPDGDVEVLPGVSMSAVHAIQWFSGERSAAELGIEFAQDEVRASTQSEVANRLMKLARERIDLEERVAGLVDAIEGTTSEHAVTAEVLAGQLTWAKTRLRLLNTAFHDADGAERADGRS